LEKDGRKCAQVHRYVQLQDYENQAPIYLEDKEVKSEDETETKYDY